MKRGEQTGVGDKYAVEGRTVLDKGKPIGVGETERDARKICNALNLQHRLHRGCIGCTVKGDLCFKCSRRPVLRDLYTRRHE